jgi:ornithine--oxo-acid transaminase
MVELFRKGLETEHAWGRSSADARRSCEARQSKGILAKDTYEHTIRIAPPLVITSDRVDKALEGIGATLRKDFS